MQKQSEEGLPVNEDVPQYPVDLTGSQNSPEPAEPVDPDEGTVEDIVNDHRLSTVKKDIPEEVEIKFLRHPVTGTIFPGSVAIIKQKHLVPCDETGKKVYDNRVFNRFN
jgi:hypothetical protein